MGNNVILQQGTVPCFEDNVKDFLEPPPMSYSIADAFSCDLNLMSAPLSLPEKGLLAAILWRSFADLESHIDSADRKAAIRWFRADGDKIQGNKFTFSEICFYLNIGGWELRVLYTKLEQAEKFELEREQALSKTYKCTTLD